MSTPSRHTFDATAEHILRLMATFEDLGRSTSTTELASILSASPSTVTTTLKRLSDQDYINYAPYRTPTLTQKGRKRGQRVSRKHKLIEQMLIRFLDMDWVEARWEAHRLEHAVSENLADRIEEALGGSVGIDSETSQAKALSSCDVGERVSVASITEEGHLLLRELQTAGVSPGSTLGIKAKSVLSGSVVVELEGKEIPIDNAVAARIIVTPLREGVQ